jgi:hypothetical protein
MDTKSETRDAEKISLKGKLKQKKMLSEDATESKQKFKETVF